MNSQRLVGIALIIIGVVLLVIGLNSSDSMSDQISKTFTDRYTKSTMWYLVGGGGLALVGVALTGMSLKKK